jgi:hypothetical protein
MCTKRKNDGGDDDDYNDDVSGYLKKLVFCD